MAGLFKSWTRSASDGASSATRTVVAKRYTVVVTRRAVRICAFGVGGFRSVSGALRFPIDFW